MEGKQYPSKITHFNRKFHRNEEKPVIRLMQNEFFDSLKTTLYV